MKKYIKGLSILLVLSLSFALHAASFAATQNVTSLAISPVALKLEKIGDIAPVEIQIKSAEYLQAAEVALSFDPMFLEIVDVSGKAVKRVTNGNVISGTGIWLFLNEVDAGKGKISYTSLYTNPEVFFTGDGTLFRFYVKAKKIGETEIGFHSNAQPLLVSTNAGLKDEIELRPAVKGATVSIGNGSVENPPAPMPDPSSGSSSGIKPGAETGAKPETALPSTGVTGSELKPGTSGEGAAKPQAPAVLKDTQGHWAESAIAKLVAENIVSGYGGNFYPNKPVSKTEFLKMLVALKKLPLPAAPKVTFTDADSIPSWALQYIAAAVEAGWVSGDDQKRLNGNQPLSRLEMAVILANVEKAAGTSGGKAFKDAAKIPSWAEAQVSAVVSKGLMSGLPDGSFQPAKSASRAEAASVIANITSLRK